MKTFILLTFGFLGFAFYQMSGGADFVPARAQLEPDTPATPEAQTVARADTTPEDPAPITRIDSTADVTQVSLDASSAIRTQPPEPEPKAEAPAAPIASDVDAAVREAIVIDSVETPQIILPSLIASSDDGSTPVRAIETSGDIRRVSGNRVNVRGGPSTDYGVVGKLTRGDEVQVLEDNGAGWVLMQPLDGGEQGWMADFLLTSG